MVSMAAAPTAARAAAAPATEVPVVATTRTGLVAERAGAAATQRTQATATPVTVKSIVTDVLTWIGLGPLATGLPLPVTPVPALVESLWLAVRQTQYTWNNQRPTAQPTVSGQDPNGVITGSLNAIDYDDALLSYTVSGAPVHGALTVDPLGNFTYTPDADADAAGGNDHFTITIDDTVGNPVHSYGLLGLIGLLGPTQATITVSVPSVALPNQALQPGAHSDTLAQIDIPTTPDFQSLDSSPDPADLAHLLARDDVVVSMNTNGTVRVIDGSFTATNVATAADAAEVLNSLAPVLGASAGFAGSADITTRQVGRTGDEEDDVSETFYRLSQNIGGVTVLGSEVILVTDADGQVTGLFNNHVDLIDGVDITPGAEIDEASEINQLASAAYLGAITAGQPDQGTLDSFVASAAFTNELIVYALDDTTDPSLAWRVVVEPTDSGSERLDGTEQPPATGATYFIHANGPNVGEVIVTISNLTYLASTTSARDSLGQERVITIESNQVFFFNSYSLVDDARSLNTYKTSYGFFGIGAPVIPGTVVKRGWFSWDAAAVSAHANTAAVYDYYDDVLGHISFDGEGALIQINVGYNPRESFLDYFIPYANAFWDPGSQQIAFGNGGNLEGALDIVGHEFTHAVVSHIVGDGGSVLDYGESGALNEAYADILGLLIEGKSGTGKWLIGEDSDFPGGALRNLADPSSIVAASGPYREHYATRYTGTADDGGQHINSTIFSFAGYKMMTDPATSFISTDTWAKVFYHSLYRLSPGAVFTDGRDAVISAARAFDFTDAQLTAIENAFDEVGVAAAASLYGVAA